MCVCVCVLSRVCVRVCVCVLSRVCVRVRDQKVPINIMSKSVLFLSIGEQERCGLSRSERERDSVVANVFYRLLPV